MFLKNGIIWKYIISISIYISNKWIVIWKYIIYRLISLYNKYYLYIKINPYILRC